MNGVDAWQNAWADDGVDTSLLLMLCCCCILLLQEMAVHVLQAEGDGGEVTCWRRVMRVPGHMQV